MILPSITPGNWEAVRTCVRNAEGERRFTCGLTRTAWADDDEMFANAKAIAAVPKLLEALNDATTTLRIMAEIAEDLMLEGAPQIREREAECVAALHLAGASN